ncbi:expansin module family protein [Metarhizium rileyi]|uniref:Expansin module family protein n=1 Tax=Metarhizium rileyi (strain RCEF 4871) TaxID=1649241 RepID=A0A167EP74_METRR|nr:expansin module family protein [Metarhizium rileyi RCEF 4871]TWU75719.1 hypothetical protein ED733_007642 [Metarhizium rileyi]
MVFIAITAIFLAATALAGPLVTPTVHIGPLATPTAPAGPPPVPAAPSNNPAAPINTPTPGADKPAGQFTGDSTYYEPGLGACGTTNSAAELIAAIPVSMYAKEHCGQQIIIKAGGNTITVTAVDKCMGCKAGDLDLSPEAFRRLFGSLDKGRAPIQWSWGSSQGGAAAHA